MCGICGVYVKQPGHYDHAKLEILADWLLLGVEHRGRDATGIASVWDGATEYTLEKADLKASKFIDWRRPLARDARMIIGHTRFATKGAKENLDNDHPVEYSGVLTTHNGHISNDDELFKTEELERYAEVDTEIIPALFWKHGLEKAHLALQKLQGNFAVAVIDPVRSPDTLVLAKGPMSPLEYVETEKLIVWASERDAIRQAWKGTFGGREPKRERWHSLGVGDMLFVTPSGIEKFEFEVDWNRKTPARATTVYSTTWAGWNDYEKRKEEAEKHVCTCGHSKWRHAGYELDGYCYDAKCECSKFVEAERKMFEQDSFVVVKNDVQHVVWECVGCGKYVDDELCDDPYGSGYLWCPACIDEIADEDVAVSSAGQVTGGSEDERPSNVVQLPVRRLAIAAAEQLDYDALTQNFVLPSDKHDVVVQRTARALGSTEAWVAWLLWESTNAELEYLQSQYIEVHDTYQVLLAEYLAELDDTEEVGGESSCGVQAFETTGGEVGL